MPGATNTLIKGGTALLTSGAGVTSVFGRSGIVIAQTGDYSIAQISGAGTAAAENLSAVIIDNGAGALTIGSKQVTNAMLANNTPNTLSGYDGSGNASDITLTTTGTSGAATISSGVLNIPQYSGGGGGGTVTTTGTPANGNLTQFSGSTSITNADLSGDVTTSGTLATTVGKVNGVSYGTSPATNTVPVVTGTNTVTYETLPIAAGGTGQTTNTTAFDALAPSAVQGNVLYFNGTHWVVLAPGTSGQFFQTQGPSANPQWATNSGGAALGLVYAFASSNLIM